MNFMMLLISVFFQIATPTPFPTIPYNENQMINSLSTVEAQLDIQATQMAITNNQAYAGGRALLPSDAESDTVFGYFKWLTSGNAASVFGPFTPIILHIAAFVALVLIGLVIFFGQMIVAAVIRTVSWIISTVMKFIPLMG